MARWKLTQPHYLMVPGTKWEYTENSRTSGKPIRKQFDVPLLLNPEDTGDWNYIDMRDQRGNAVEGSVIVCHDGRGQDKDITFVGPPTPDMIPLDDEAKAISAKLNIKPGFAEEMPEGGYAGKILEGLSKQLADAMAANPLQQAVMPNMDKFLESQERLNSQLAALLAALTPAVTAKAAERRV